MVKPARAEPPVQNLPGDGPWPEGQDYRPYPARRLAATSVAKRIAQELQSEIGDWARYQIRFNDKTGPRSAIKLMTDGILLAESQRDPLLSRYDTIIIDEAHQRTQYNIDFLLGFFKTAATPP